MYALCTADVDAADTLPWGPGIASRPTLMLPVLLQFVPALLEILPALLELVPELLGFVPALLGVEPLAVLTGLL